MARLLHALIAFNLAIPCAQAEDRYADERHANIDIASFTCGQFLDGLKTGDDAAKMHDLVMWLEGYMGGISGNTELNWQDLKDYKKDLLAFCNKNNTLGLLEAARKAAVE